MDSKVEITRPDGTKLTPKEAEAFLKKLRAGVVFIPQNREMS